MITLKGNSANLEGLSTDQKPTDVPVNIEFRELDTNCRFYFTGESWEEIPSSGGGGGSGTSNYNELENKPQIAGVTLSGNKTLANLGIQGELSFDNAPTEDSTNPVTSGGVYEALEAKQDTLTIDDTPTEDSTNPVTSGGVYSALENKQDNLVFDGTYDSSTNKVATESTVSDAVSTAIGNLSKSDVGLDNVTNNTQIKALSGSVTSGGIVTFGADGATVSDSGKTIETNLSNSNDNVPTSKAVRDKVAGSATMASNYTTDSSESSITSASTINDAIEQLDYRTTTNKNNILLIEQMNGAKNIIQTNVLDTQYASGFTITNNNGKIILNGSRSGVGYVGIPVTLKAGQYYLSGCPSGGSMNNYRVDLRLATGGDLYVDLGDTGGGFAFTVSSDVQLVYNIRIANGYTCNNLEFKPMIITKSAYDAGFTDFQPHALPNTAITPALQECVDNGKKNELSYSLERLKALNTSGTWSGNSYTFRGVTFTYNESTKEISTYGTSTVANAVFHFDTGFIPKSGTTYVLSGCPRNGSASGYRLCNMGVSWANDFGDSATAIGDGTAKDIAIYVASANIDVGTSSNPLVWKPMLCEKALYDVSPQFEPYALNNVELTNKVNDITPAHVITTTTSTSVTITGIDNTYNTNCLLMLTDRRETANADDMVLYLSRYLTEVRIFKIVGTGTAPTATISGDVITLSGLRTYQTITALSNKAVTITPVT